MRDGGSSPESPEVPAGDGALTTFGAGPSSGLHEPSSRVRYRLWLGGLAVLIALAYLATIRTVTFPGDAAIRFGPDADAVSVPNFDGGAHAVVYRHGGTVSFSFPLRNGALVGITVRGIRLSEDGRYPLLTIEQVSVNGDELPARVGRGDTARVDVTARYDNCRYYHERELDLLTGATVEASALGMAVTRQVSFDHPLVVRSPMIVDCPDRTIDRGDDIRG